MVFPDIMSTRLLWPAVSSSALAKMQQKLPTLSIRALMLGSGGCNVGSINSNLFQQRESRQQYAWSKGELIEVEKIPQRPIKTSKGNFRPKSSDILTAAAVIFIKLCVRGCRAALLQAVPEMEGPFVKVPKIL